MSFDKPPIFLGMVNDIHTTYKNGDVGDGLWHCFTHFINYT